MSRNTVLAAALAAALGIASLLQSQSAAADVTITTTVRAGNDSVNWGQLGTCNTKLPNPFTATSANGLTLTVSGTNGPLYEDVQSPPGCSYDGWDGNFAPGDNLLLALSYLPADSMTVDFSSPVSAVGTQFQSNALGVFDAGIVAYDGTTMLGIASEGGNSTEGADNSAIYLGIQDLTGADITSVTLDASVIGTFQNPFTINELSLEDTVAPVPEPASLALFAIALAALGFIRSRRRGNS